MHTDKVEYTKLLRTKYYIWFYYRFFDVNLQKDFGLDSEHEVTVIVT